MAIQWCRPCQAYTRWRRRAGADEWICRACGLAACYDADATTTYELMTHEYEGE